MLSICVLTKAHRLVRDLWPICLGWALARVHSTHGRIFQNLNLALWSRIKHRNLLVFLTFLCIIHFWRLTWNTIMEVWKIIFLSNYINGWFVGFMLIFQAVSNIKLIHPLLLIRKVGISSCSNDKLLPAEKQSAKKQVKTPQSYLRFHPGRKRWFQGADFLICWEGKGEDWASLFETRVPKHPQNHPELTILR